VVGNHLDLLPVACQEQRNDAIQPERLTRSDVYRQTVELTLSHSVGRVTPHIEANQAQAICVMAPRAIVSKRQLQL